MHRTGLDYVKEARKLLEISMGAHHPFITGELVDLENLACEDPDIMIEQRIAKQREKVTEIVCPCCGKKKVIRTIEEVTDKLEEKWERDMRIKKQIEEDTKIYKSDLYVKY